MWLVRTRRAFSTVSAAPAQPSAAAERTLLGQMALPTLNRRVSSEPKLMSSFLFWLGQKNADFRHVDVRPVVASEPDGQCGVFAATDLKQGTPLIRLPLRCTLSALPPAVAATVAPANSNTVRGASTTAAFASAVTADLPSTDYEKSFQSLIELIPAELHDMKLGLRLLAERCV